MQNYLLFLSLNFFTKMANLHKINNLRKQKILTWKTLSEELGISQVGLQKIMSSNSTKIETLERIAAFFNVPVAYFFDEYDNETNDIKNLRDELKDCQEHRNAIQGNQNVYIELIADLINFIDKNNFKDTDSIVINAIKLFKLLGKNNEKLLNNK